MRVASSWHAIKATTQSSWLGMRILTAMMELDARTRRLLGPPSDELADQVVDMMDALVDSLGPGLEDDLHHLEAGLLVFHPELVAVWGRAVCQTLQEDLSPRALQDWKHFLHIVSTTLLRTEPALLSV